MAVCIENNVNGRFLAACYTSTLYALCRKAMA